MRVAACVMAVLASAAINAPAQNFVNLDFDQAQLPDPAEGFLFLPWDKGAPGWGHSDGENTDHLTYPDVHLGFSQTYALMPAPYGPASGFFGLGMRSGSDDFVQTFLTQTGTVGAAVTSVSLLTSSYLFELSLNGNRIDMQPVGLDPESPTYAEDLTRYEGEWTGNVSAFAGQVVELRISNLELPQNSPRLIVDEIRFLPVPEMSTAALFGPGLLTVLLGAAWSTRARRARPGSPRGAQAHPPQGNEADGGCHQHRRMVADLARAQLRGAVGPGRSGAGAVGVRATADGARFARAAASIVDAPRLTSLSSICSGLPTDLRWG